MVPQLSRDQRRTARSEESALAIDAEDVHVTYDDGTEAVRGVNLAIPEGEFFGFLGPNGAGKTTTIKTLVTLLHPTSGSVSINGYDTRTESQAVRESLGYMAQETSIDLELTPRENLRVACEVYGVPADEREARIDDLLDLVDLQDVADKRAETFSGGMQKRLDTATVLVHRPPVVFLDEPTTGLDPEARRRVWAYIEQINDNGTTVFLTTQYLEEADKLCDRLAILEDGEIIATGTPESLKTAVGTETLRLDLETPTDRQKRRAVETVRGIDSLDVAAVETTPDGLVVETPDARVATSDIFASFAAADIAVNGFEVDAPTLDDVFLSLTGDDAAGTDRDDAAETERDATAVAPQEVSR